MSKHTIDAFRVVRRYRSRRGHMVEIAIHDGKTYKETLQNIANSSCASTTDITAETRKTQPRKVAA